MEKRDTLHIRLPLKLVWIVLAIAAFPVVVFLANHDFVESTTAKKSPLTSSAQPEIATPQQLLAELNRDRAAAGLGSVSLDDRLNSSASAHLADMNAYTYFAHDNPITGKHSYDWINETGIKCMSGSGGENIQEQPGSNTQMDAYHVITDSGGYMGSESHKEAMMDPTIDVVGFATDRNINVMHMCDLVN